MDSVYDRALSEIGQNGPFQKGFDLFYIVIFNSLWAMAYSNIILALVVVPYTCNVPNRPVNISENVWKSKYIPSIDTVDGAGKIKLSNCLIYEDPGISNATKECDSFDYDKTWYGSTVTTDNNWVCENEIYVANVLGYSKIGEGIGSIFFGWFGDMYGRRITYAASLVMLILGRVISIAGSSSFILFTIGSIISSFPSWSAIQSATVISIEISDQKRRSTTATLRIVAWSMGLFIMPFLYWWLRDWKIFMIVTTATQIPYIFLSWKLIESPRWLLIEGKQKTCIKHLKEIAKVNKTSLNVDTEKEILSTPYVKDSQALGPLSLFTGWKLAMNTLLQMFIWIAVSLSYTMLILISGEKSDGNPFLEFAWQSVAEIPGNLIGAWIADKYGRRPSSIIPHGITVILWILICCREAGMSSWLSNSWVGTILIMSNRLCATTGFYAITLFNMELYPTCLRQSGMSLCNIVASVASAVAPYLMYLGHQVDSRLPGAVLAAVALMAALSSYLLPETLNAKLPETVEDAREFGKKKQKYTMVNLQLSSIKEELKIDYNSSG